MAYSQDTREDAFTSKLQQTLADELSGQPEWRIDALELAGRIPEIKYRYPSHIVPAVKSAVNKINRQSELQIGLQIEKPQRGKATLIFLKRHNGKGLPRHGEPAVPVGDRQPAKDDGAAWETCKALLGKAFSLYHLTFARLAEADHVFLKWGKASKEERDVLMAGLEAGAWQRITHNAERHMSSLTPSERAALQEKYARVLNEYSTDKKVISLIAYLLEGTS